MKRFGGILVLLSAILLIILYTGFHADSISVELGDNTQLSQSYTYESITGTFFVSPFGTQEHIEEFIEKTKYELVGRQYQITEKDIVNQLKGLSFLGRQVDIILENKTYGNQSDAYESFLRKIDTSNVRVQHDEHLGTNFIHAKALIRDRKEILIASANLTYPSFRRNREYRLLVSHQELAENLWSLFMKDKVGERIDQIDIHPALVFCPIDCREKTQYVLQSAEKSIILSMQYIEDPSIISLLRQKYNEGIDVQLLVGAYQDVSALSGLESVTKIYDDSYLHTKSILIDGVRLLHGSANLSRNALDNNREIGIMLGDPELIQSFVWQFDRDRAKGLYIAEFD